MKQSKISIDLDGVATAIYSDDLADLFDALGDAEISRASDVEPDGCGGWVATMRASFTGCCPVKLGSYRLRAEALAAEVEYLEKALFGAAGPVDGRGV